MLHTWKAFAGGVWPAKKKILAARARKASENNRARKCTRQNVLELAHVSLFAGYGDLEAATTVEPVTKRHRIKRSVFKVPKITSLDVL